MQEGSLESMDMRAWLRLAGAGKLLITDSVQNVNRLIKRINRDGESGPNARECHYDWILNTRRQCIEHGVTFHFKQTGAVFVKDGKTYHIERRFQQIQAEKAGIDYVGTIQKDDDDDIQGRRIGPSDRLQSDGRQMELTDLLT